RRPPRSPLFPYTTLFRSAQGYLVDATTDAAMGADMALTAPPAAMIADLWMPSISGVQLCRLLRAEPATAEVPVILRGEDDDPKRDRKSTRLNSSHVKISY